SLALQARSSPHAVRSAGLRRVARVSWSACPRVSSTSARLWVALSCGSMDSPVYGATSPSISSPHEPPQEEMSEGGCPRPTALLPCHERHRCSSLHLPDMVGCLRLKEGPGNSLTKRPRGHPFLQCAREQHYSLGCGQATSAVYCLSRCDSVRTFQQTLCCLEDSMLR